LRAPFLASSRYAQNGAPVKMLWKHWVNGGQQVPMPPDMPVPEQQVNGAGHWKGGPWQMFTHATPLQNCPEAQHEVGPHGLVPCGHPCRQAPWKQI
jgi:hypothetical protein